MNTTRQRVPFAAIRHSSSCSVLVLAGLGLLASLKPQPALGQSAGTPLPAGTLPVLRGVVSGQATFRTTITSGPLLTVNQTTPRAIIDWRSFDIAGDSAVRFDQPSSTASVLNRIYSANPSVIQGRLTANGQVLLINQNGILFDRGTQINVQSLVASTLNISNTRFNSGALTTGGLTSPAFEGGYDNAGETVTLLPAGSALGPIRIGGGAAAAPAPSLNANAGGSIIVVAPRIDNVGGMIAAPDGQVILAAGGKAYLTFADPTNPAEAALRGFRVEVEAADGNPLNITNLIRNAGSISADRGNVTLAALAVNQDGRISANTAIQANGSIFLQARTLGGAQAGTVRLGAGSVTEVQPDAADTATLPESQSFADRRGEIRVDGRTIESRGALRAAGGRITLAAQDPTDPSAARIYLDAGSETSVAGNWADVPLASSLLTFKVTSNELRDSPDQKNGLLRGATVTVDLRRGSPLLDLSGYVAAQARTVGEKTAQGGDLVLTSTGSLIQRAGATLDASGGGYRHAGGTAPTSLLLSDDGRVYDIGSAPAGRNYTALLDTFTQTFSRYNQTQTFTGLTYGIGRSEAAYLEGKAGGTMHLQSAAGLVLDGTLRGGATAGPNQLARAPRGATLMIGTFDAIDNQFDAAQRIGNVTFNRAATDSLGVNFTVATSLAQAQIDNVALGAAQLFAAADGAARNVYAQTAFDTVEINSNGRVAVPEGVVVEGAPGSSLLLRAPRIDVAGAIVMPAGAITLQPVNTVDPISAEAGGANLGVRVHGTARLSTAGVWVNNAGGDGSFVGAPLPSARVNVAADGSTSPTSLLAGGRIAIGTDSLRVSATVLERGASIDVGGGGAIDSRSRLTLGDGGSLSIANGQSSSLSSDWLQADLSGLSAGNGGTLTLSTPRVVIDSSGTNGTLPADTTRLSPELFSERGFSSVTINTTQGIEVSAGTPIALRQSNRVIDPVRAAALANGGDLRHAADIAVLPDDQRRPASLALASSGFGPNQGRATVVLAEGAAIVADPRARVSLSAVDGLRVDGLISAPGGAVSLSLAAPAEVGAPDLRLGARASISTAATFVRRPTDSGLVQGAVVDAGMITIAASNAGVRLDAGSLLDVSGTTRVVEAVRVDGGGVVQRQTVDGNAGGVVVRSQGATDLQSTLRGARGSAQGAGGAFALELNARNTELTPPAERRIVVTQQVAGRASAPDPAFVDAAVSVDALQAAGFERLRLQSENRVELRGDVAMDFRRGIRIDAPLLEVTGDGRASLAGSSVALGQSRDPRRAEGTLDPKAPSPALPTRAGDGVLSVRADTIDLFGSLALNGVAEARFFAEGDIRMTGRSVNVPSPAGDRIFGTQVGALTTPGNVVLSAAQVYPSTRSDYTIAVTDASGGTRPGGSIALSGNGGTAGDVYSAGGRLALAADTIVQGGTIKAPLGEIDLRAGARLELSPGSVTSVSASDLTIPFGSTRAGLSWTYQDSPSGLANLLTTASADAKGVTLTGRAIDVRPGATVDLSGGGEIQALEFVPGSGGNRNTLLQPNTFAIIPAARLTSMPVDPDSAAASDIGFGLQTARVDTGVYDQLRIGSGAVVPAGDYVLLPGRYALLPGAFLVQLQTGNAYANLQPGQTEQLANGQTVVAGRRIAGGTTIGESRTVGVVVRPGTAANRESDYRVTSSSFFTALADRQRNAPPRVPLDAGRLVFAEAAALNLAGTFATRPGIRTEAGVATSGRTSEVDIAADRIAVVDRAGTAGIAPNVLQLESGALAALGGSLLLGGTRRPEGDAVRIATRASEVVVANTSAAPLQVAELMLTANDVVEVRAGSVLAGRGTTTGAERASIVADPGGALVRLAAGPQASVDRGPTVVASRGTIRIEAGAVLGAGGSLLLDATRTTQSQGRFDVAAGGAVALASSRVSLGEIAGVPGIADGLVLSNADLSSLAALDVLQIRGYQGIDLYGNARIGAGTLGQLTLDSAELRGRSVGALPLARIEATDVRFVNTGAAAAPSPLVASGSLTVDASRIVVGTGAQSIGGYGTVTMNAASEVVAEGRGGLDVAGDWTLRTPRVGVAAGADQRWRAADLRDPVRPAYGALRLDGAPGNSGTTAAEAAGGRLALEGRSVAVGTVVQARSGALVIAARGSDAGDGVSVAAGGVLDAAGNTRDFNGRAVSTDGGRVSLSAAAGAVALAAGAAVRLGADAIGGDAGLLEVAAARFTAAGTLDAGRGLAGAGGRARLDLGSVADVAGLNAALSRGGFDESIDLRVRNGDVSIGAGDVVRARQVQIAADRGRIDIAGTLDARSVRGDGRIDVATTNGLALSAGSRVLAGGSSVDGSLGAPASDGGAVRLATASGRLDFDAASTIDVSPGAKGRTGTVSFGIGRDGANQPGAIALAGTVLGRNAAGAGTLSDIAIEARRTYDYASTSPRSVSAADIASYAADHAAFIAGANASSLVGALRADDGVAAAASVQGATEVRTAGDMTVAQPWNLASAQWRTGDRPGTLTLRAGGDLTLSSSLGMVNDTIIDGKTWNLRLVGGADLAAADAMATLSPEAAQGRGNVILQGNAARVRTGTGSIDFAAATDFRMASNQSAVYTAGRIGAADTATNGNNRWSTDGGDISIRAGRDAIGAADQWITDWLRRPRGLPANVPAEWWVYRPNFQQGVGTLGGGDIAIDAGRDVSRLSAMLPTTGRSAVNGAGVRSVDVQGGGDLSVRAGNDIVGGGYLIARGAGRVEAGGSVGTGAPTQLFLMGASSGDVPAQAGVSVAAGSGIALQSVNNPTALQQATFANRFDTANGPSFGGGPTTSLTYFSYAPDSAVSLVAESGNVAVGSRMAPGRGLGIASQSFTDGTDAGAFPASLNVAALAGNIALDERRIVTFPSATAELRLLAQGTLTYRDLRVSDLSPGSVANVANPRATTPAIALSGAFYDPAGAPTGVVFNPADRIVDRPVVDGYRFDLQALDGDITSARADASELRLPGVSRIRAGRDVINVQLTLQNLNGNDVSQVRADNGDVRPAGIEMRGPGALLVQAGRNVDIGAAELITGGASLGGLVATANNANAALRDSAAARLVVIAGVKGDVDPARFGPVYVDLIGLSSQADNILAFYRALNGDPNREAVLGAMNVQELVARDVTYAPYAEVVTRYPRLLAVYQESARTGALPLGVSAEASQAAALYALLNRESDGARIGAASSVADLVTATAGGSAYQAFVALDAKYPRVFADYRLRRSRGATPEGLTPILLSDALAEVTARVVPAAAVGPGDIFTFQSSIQTYGNGQAPAAGCTGQCPGQGDIELWAPGGGVVAGLTTPSAGRTIGIVTNAGGAIRSVVGNDFEINQGKVLTAQGGDLLIFSSGGSIDAGRGARTSISTPPPTRTPIIDNGVQIGILFTLPAGASGSGIQTVSSDPDGIGPRAAPAPGNVYLFAPAGTIDAGEAGIRSSGNIVIAAQTVLNASNISASGSSAGVPVVATGSLASTVAASGTTTGSTSKAAEDAAAAAATTARAAAAAAVTRPNILSVEVLGFGDKNCREQDKDCFAK